MDKFFKSHNFIFHFFFQVFIMHQAYIKNNKLMQNGKPQHLFLVTVQQAMSLLFYMSAIYLHMRIIMFEKYLA